MFGILLDKTYLWPIIMTLAELRPVEGSDGDRIGCASDWRFSTALTICLLKDFRHFAGR